MRRVLLPLRNATLEKTGQQLHDVIRRQLLSGETLMRERTVDQFLEVFDSRLASKCGITHTTLPGSTTTSGGCKARSDEL